MKAFLVCLSALLSLSQGQLFNPFLPPNPIVDPFYNAAAVTNALAAPNALDSTAVVGASCFPERCQACKDSFLSEPIATFDCNGKCGLCALCEGSAKSVPDCDRWCRAGELACATNCNRGKQLCLRCAGYCGIFK